MSTSIFSPFPASRTTKTGYPVLRLSTQYRMHPSIRHFPSNHFYGNRLRDGPNVLHSSPYHAPAEQLYRSVVESSWTQLNRAQVKQKSSPAASCRHLRATEGSQALPKFPPFCFYSLSHSRESRGAGWPDMRSMHVDACYLDIGPCRPIPGKC